MLRFRPPVAVSLVVVASLVLSVSALADVKVTDVGAWRDQQRAAKVAKKEKRARAAARSAALSVSALATGSQRLVDQSGLEYFINTDITFSTSSSASGAASEASYTGPVQATTLNGGLVATTLNDAFDGYNALCLSSSATGPCETGNASYVMFNRNGAATLDGTCGGRQVLFGTQTMLGLQVTRKVFVPSNDSFARWQTVLTNPTGAPITVNVISSNNLGSDANTVIDSSSSGDASASTADYWVSTFQNYSGTTSSDPRLAHVVWGPGGAGPSGMTFANGDDNPYWSFQVTVPAGATRILLHFVTGQPSRAAARAKAAQIATSPLSATAAACMTEQERGEIVNFGAAVAEKAIPALGGRGLLALVAAIAAAGFAAQRRLA